MRKICAWCYGEIGLTDPPDERRSTISYGICQECANLFLADQGVHLSAFLDALDIPVLLVDDDVRVIGANTLALSFVQKDLPKIENNHGGDVFECIYAATPEGCGKTIHCSGCAIRIAVRDTFYSGSSHREIPAYLKCGRSGQPTRIGLLISTEKVNEAVLLKIDSVT
jgi:hypothetical protein